MTTKTQPYALYHVHRQTGEKVRYPTHSFPSGTKEEIEQLALDSRIGVGRGSPKQGEWRTESHPEEKTQ